MRKIINGKSKQVYEVVVDLGCCSDNDVGEKAAKAIEKALKKRGVVDYELTFSSWRVEINIYDRKDTYYLMCLLDSLMNEEKSRINKFEITVSTF